MHRYVPDRNDYILHPLLHALWNDRMLDEAIEFRPRVVFEIGYRYFMYGTDLPLDTQLFEFDLSSVEIDSQPVPMLPSHERIILNTELRLPFMSVPSIGYVHNQYPLPILALVRKIIRSLESAVLGKPLDYKYDAWSLVSFEDEGLNGTLSNILTLGTMQIRRDDPDRATINTLYGPLSDTLQCRLMALYQERSLNGDTDTLDSQAKATLMIRDIKRELLKDRCGMLSPLVNCLSSKQLDKLTADAVGALTWRIEKRWNYDMEGVFNNLIPLETYIVKDKLIIKTPKNERNRMRVNLHS